MHSKWFWSSNNKKVCKTRQLLNHPETLEKRCARCRASSVCTLSIIALNERCRRRMTLSCDNVDADRIEIERTLLAHREGTFSFRIVNRNDYNDRWCNWENKRAIDRVRELFSSCVLSIQRALYDAMCISSYLMSITIVIPMCTIHRSIRDGYLQFDSNKQRVLHAEIRIDTSCDIVVVDVYSWSIASYEMDICVFDECVNSDWNERLLLSS